MDILEQLEKHYEIHEDDAGLMEAIFAESKLETTDGELYMYHQEKYSIVKVNGFYIKYKWYLITGDLCMGDLELELSHLVDYIDQVYPVEIKTVKYVNEKP